MGFAEGGEKNILDHFFGVAGHRLQNAQRDVVEFAGIKVESLLQGGVVAGLEAGSRD